MKIVHVNTQDWGGAAGAALTLHRALDEKVDSKFVALLRRRSVADVEGFFNSSGAVSSARNFIRKAYRPALNKIITIGKKEGYTIFTSPRSGCDLASSPAVADADIVHLHWASHFIDFPSFFGKIDKPVVWTLHDMNPFTGGCHHSLSCEKFRENCAACPQIKKTISPNLAERNLGIKLRALEDFEDLTIVSPSKFLLKKSKESFLFSKFEHKRIPNPFDIFAFNIGDKIESRKRFGIAPDEKVVAFAAEFLDDKFKGYRTLIKALKLIGIKITALAAGNRTGKVGLGWIKSIQTGSLRGPREMAKLYSAADVFVLPSFAENFPNTIVEANLCGTPAIVFPVGGMPEIVDNGKNGLVCREPSVYALAESLEIFFKTDLRFNPETVRESVLHYAKEKIARKYLKLYRNILDGR